MIKVRLADERGLADHGWLRSFHTFSFADYYDPAHMGFRALRVINEDRVAPGKGFGTHGHSDMEIVSYVLSGAIEHKDSMGNGSVIRPGDVQRMSAGTGVRHSEFNGSASEPVHFLQIWIMPDKKGIEPGYEQKNFPAADKQGVLRLVASPTGEEGSVTIHASARLYAGLFDAGQETTHPLPAGHGAYVHVAKGNVRINGKPLGPGDAAALEGEPNVHIDQGQGAEVLLFDLA
jgi:quercetin 2,3-dioxygenase